MNNATWIFKNGAAISEYTSFPYAYRTMWNAVRKGVEKGQRFEDITKPMSIISPIKDLHGDFKKYTYAQATTMATSQGLLTADGQINSREFKRQ